MIDGSEKHNGQLAFELEICMSVKSAVNKVRSHIFGIAPQWLYSVVCSSMLSLCYL